MYLPEMVRKYTIDKEPSQSRSCPGGQDSLSRFPPAAQNSREKPMCVRGHWSYKGPGLGES